jgi:hypothetical protein
MAVCVNQLPDEPKVVIIPQYLAINIKGGTLIEHTVGTASVTGVALSFDMGDGFTAVGTEAGVFIIGGS